LGEAVTLKADRRIAELLVENDIIRFNVESPFQYTSGIRSPVYIDCRAILSNVELRDEVIGGLKALVEENVSGFDGFSGTAVAGIPWASFLADRCRKRMLFVRKESRIHGLGKRIEGLFEAGQRYVIVEDHVSTGGSLLNHVKVLRDAGLVVNDCIAVTTYDFKESSAAFMESDVSVHALMDLATALDASLDKGIISKADADSVKEWLENPRDWKSKNG
jgi:orotate phosphoribosyltransferase